MGEQRQGATYLTFKGGLNTEASALNAPAEDAAEMVNIELTSAGTVRRRPGIDLLPQLDVGTLFVTETTDYTAAAGKFVEPAPASVSFRVTKNDGSYFRAWIAHIGRSIYIYDQTLFPTLRDMSQYQQRLEIPAEFPDRCAHFKTVFVRDGNRVYILNPYIPLSYLFYDEDAGEFVYATETIKIRDFKDSIASDSRVSEGEATYRCILSHIATADNQPGTGPNWRDVWVLEGKKPDVDPPDAWSLGVGDQVWIDTGEVMVDTTETTIKKYAAYDCIQTHTSSVDNKPPNATYWVPSPAEGQGGTNEISWGEPSGVLWAAGRNYSQANGFSYVSNIKPLRLYDAAGFPRGFSCGALAAGRLWLAAPAGEPNTLYFSQAIVEDENYSRMYQWADPRNPDDPDIVETDGGRIKISAAEEIVGVADYRGGVLILATNGIWYLTGSDGYFKATTYSIQKITDDGCFGRHAWTIVEDNIIYAGISGIYAIQLDQVSVAPQVAELSTKIKSFWTSIPRFMREACEMAYNPDTFRLVIGTNFDVPLWWGIRNPYNQATRMRDFLIFDIKLKAWYTYRMASDNNGSRLSPCNLSSLIANISDTEDVTVLGVPVTANGSPVVVPTTKDPKQTMIGIIHVIKDGDNVKWSLGLLEGNSFIDYNQSPDDAETYEGYLQTVPQLFADLGHRKQVAYLHTAFERVEDGFNLQTLEFTNPGGCFYRILWDWAIDETAGTKWGNAYQAYKPNRYNLQFEDGQVIGMNVVKSKHRIRGHGKAVAFRFETDGDKDFHLLGWQADIYASEKV